MPIAASKNKKPVVFSDQLLEAIEQTHSRGEQSIILLNRRGYSSFILCRSCGESIMCPNCEVTLTFHRGDRVLAAPERPGQVRGDEIVPELVGRLVQAAFAEHHGIPSTVTDLPLAATRPTARARAT